MGKSPRQSRTATLLIGFLLLFDAASAFAAPGDSAAVKRILVLGDSLSAGFGLSSKQAYPSILAEKMRNAGLTNFEITNASQSGGTTTGGLQRLPAHLKRRPDIFILELGINDAFRGIPITQIRNNLQSIVDLVKQRGANTRIIIAGMQLPNYSADDYVSAFGQLYTNVAEKNNAVLIPYLLEGVGGDPNLNQTDHVHPNAAGQKVLAETVWRVLEPIAREIATDQRPARVQ